MPKNFVIENLFIYHSDFPYKKCLLKTKRQTKTKVKNPPQIFSQKSHFKKALNLVSKKKLFMKCGVYTT